MPHSERDDLAPPQTGVSQGADNERLVTARKRKTFDLLVRKVDAPPPTRAPKKENRDIRRRGSHVRTNDDELLGVGRPSFREPADREMRPQSSPRQRGGAR